MDRQRRYFVSTTSDTQPGAPYVRQRLREVNNSVENVQLIVPQPAVCEIYYRTCAQIDRHNRCRQDDLKLEKKIETKCWHFRLNCSILGMIIVDSWLLYKGLQGNREKMGQREFYEQLAEELIKQSRNLNSIRDFDSELSNRNGKRVATGIHLIRTSRKRRGSTGTVQLTCRICRRRTSHFCSDCTQGVWICHAETGQNCFDTHLKSIHDC